MKKTAMNVRVVFGGRVRSRRVELGLSQVGVAREMACDVSLVSHFECGGRLPSAENLVKLADALDTTADYLLGRVKEASW